MELRQVHLEYLEAKCRADEAASVGMRGIAAAYEARANGLRATIIGSFSEEEREAELLGF